MSWTAKPTGPLAWLGVLLIELGQMTAIVAVAPTASSAVVAVLVTVPQASGAVGLVTWTVWLCPASRVKVPHPNVSLGGAPAMVHVAGPCWSAMVQSTPDAAGSGSVSVTPLAGNGPGLVRVMVKPIGSPAETLGTVGSLGQERGDDPDLLGRISAGPGGWPMKWITAVADDPLVEPQRRRDEVTRGGSGG